MVDRLAKGGDPTAVPLPRPKTKTGDWSFSDEYTPIAVEVRPDEPHSVTTFAFLHEGSLHVPAMNGSEKEWPGIVLRDDRVRLKLGDNVYPVKLVRVEPDGPLGLGGHDLAAEENQVDGLGAREVFGDLEPDAAEATGDQVGAALA